MSAYLFRATITDDPEGYAVRLHGRGMAPDVAAVLLRGAADHLDGIGNGSTEPLTEAQMSATFGRMVADLTGRDD